MPIVSPPSRDSTIEPPFFWERYKAEIVAALVVGLLAMAAAGGYRLYTIHRDSSAAELLAAAKTSGDFQNVIARFPSTPACAAAYLLLANEQRSQKKFADSNANLEALIAKFPRHELITTAWMGMAANFESLGKKDEALTTYQRLLANYPKDFNAPLAMISQVHLLVEKNQIEEARRVCENIITQHRESAVAGEAARRLRLLPGAKTPESSAQIPSSTPATPQGAPALSAAPTISKPANPTPGKP